MTPQPRKKLPRTLVFLLAVEVALLSALIGSGFWEGGMKWSWGKGYVIGTLTHGAVSVSHWDFSHMSSTFQNVNKPGFSVNGNAVVPDENRPKRWMWSPNAYARTNSVGPKVHALRVPLWMLALIPLAIVPFSLLVRLKQARQPAPSPIG